MTHNPAPIQGAACRAHRRSTIRSSIKSIGLVSILLAAPSVAFAQVSVSVVASDDTAGETPTDNGEFIVRRVGGLPILPVTVNYSLSGTATPGDDYAPLSGSVTFDLLQAEASTCPRSARSCVS